MGFRNPFRALLAFLLILLLAAAALIFTRSGGIALLFPGDPAPKLLIFDKTSLQPGRFTLEVSNPTPEAVTLTTVNINDALMPFIVQPGTTIAPFGSATLYLLYPWVAGENYTISVFTSDSESFTTEVSSAAATPEPPNQVSLNFLMIGLAAGLLPLLCGVVWFPALGRTGLYLFLKALAAGMLVYLGINTVITALQHSQELSGAFQGIGLVAVASAVVFLFLQGLSSLQAAAREEPAGSRQGWLFASRVGMQNFALGLSAGTSFSFGLPKLGMLFILGMFIHNIASGLDLVASLEKSCRTFSRLLVLGIIAGAPAILGVWMGGSSESQPLQVLYFSIGAGVVFQAVYEAVLRIHRATEHQPRPMPVYGGAILGLVALYVTGLFTH